MSVTVLSVAVRPSLAGDSTVRATEKKNEKKRKEKKKPHDVSGVVEDEDSKRRQLSPR